MNKKFFYYAIAMVLIVLGILIVGYRKESRVIIEEHRESTLQLRPVSNLKNVIEIRAEGEILHYKKESLWNEKDFSKILKSKNESTSKEVSSFRKDLERYNRYLVNPKIEFDEVGKSTTLICDVKGAMYSTNSYEFHWLLGDLPFDLYQFKQSERELYYEGEINSIPTTIRLIFPFIIAHCHEHVWPR